MAGNRNLLLRVASAAVALPVVGLLVYAPEPWLFGGFSLLAAALALHEFSAIALADRPRGARGAVVVVGLLLALAVYLRPDMALAWFFGGMILMSVCSMALSRGPAGGPLSAAHLGVSGFGIVYAGALVMALALLQRDVPQGRLWVALAAGVTFAGDTAAYFVGRALGRHKLAPRISPGKTVEGGVGGLLGALAFALLAKATFFDELTGADVILVGLAGGVLGPAGDLCESYLKRSAGVKDSGRLIPGHGGILDRIDALIFVGAYVYLHALYLH